MRENEGKYELVCVYFASVCDLCVEFKGVRFILFHDSEITKSVRSRGLKCEVYDSFALYSPYLDRTEDGIHYLLDVVTMDAEKLMTRIFSKNKRPSSPMGMRPLYS